MPTWLKVLLILLAIGVVSVIAFFVAIIGGLAWFAANADEIKKNHAIARQEGHELGQSHDTHACLTDGIAHEKKCGIFGMRCMDANAYRVWTCVDAAPDRDDFCAKIPAKSEMSKSTQWYLSECRKLDRLGSQPCQRVLMDAQQGCEQGEIPE
jgi:hypothetical protein